MTLLPNTIGATIKTDADLARELDLDRSVVCRLKKRGMPTHSIDAARRWRDENMRPTMRKDTNPARARIRIDAPAEARAALAAVELLRPAAEAALVAGLFDRVRRPLRVALAGVPNAIRQHVRLSEGLWSALCGVSAPQAASQMLDQAASQSAGVVWYCLASGEAL